MALNPKSWFKRAGKILQFPAPASSTQSLPVSQDGKPPAPHEFLQAQIVNLPTEEESAQKRVFFAVMYFMATWVFAPVCGLLGYGLAQDLMHAFGVVDFYAGMVAVVFALLEVGADAVCALLGERIYQGLKTGGDLAYTLCAIVAVLIVQAGTGFVQIGVLSNQDAALAGHLGIGLYIRAFAPLALMIIAVLITAGVQRRSLKRMINAIDRKSEALVSVAHASVRYLEADMNARRAIDEHADAKARREQDAQQLAEFHKMQRDAFEREQERNRKRDEEDNGNGRRGRF